MSLRPAAFFRTGTGTARTRAAIEPDDGRPPVLVVAGLAAEARTAAGLYTIAIAAPPAALAAKLDAVSEPISAVLSFGICGGIAENLHPGALVVPDAIVARSESFATTRELADKLRKSLRHHGFEITEKSIAGTNAPVLTVAAKSALHATSGCVAVDTESHVAAAFARRRGLPFVAIRAICDAADRDLPPLAFNAIGPDGRLDWRAIGGELLNRPGQLLQLPGTALATAKALITLRRVRRRLGPRLGL